MMRTIPKEIHLRQLKTLKVMVALEVEGMTRRGRPATQIVRQEFGITKRRKIDVYFEFCRLTKQTPSDNMIAKKRQQQKERLNVK